jgi:hypothetical protein
MSAQYSPTATAGLMNTMTQEELPSFEEVGHIQHHICYGLDNARLPKD